MRRIALLLCLVLALRCAALAEDSQFIEHEPLTLDGVRRKARPGGPGEYFHYYPFTVEGSGAGDRARAAVLRRARPDHGRAT